LIEDKFNYDAIDDYLAFRYVRDPYTFFELVLAVKPGRYLKFNKAMEIDEVVYWSIDYQSPIIKDVNENEQIINLKNLLENSVRYRLISDVPVGTYLSGGLDSSLITAIAANISNNPINTFITGFDELNEFYYARKVSESYSTKHLEILINKETYLNELENIIKFKDAPMAVPNEISLAQMSLELSKKIKVVLSGEGADEVFAGYGRIFKSGFDYDAMAIRTPFYKYFINRYEYTSREFRDKFILSSKNLRILSDEKYSLIINDLSKEDFISKFFIESHLPGLLYRLDSTTMLAGVEARVPFLDHNLVEYVFKNLNFNQKIKWKNNNQIPKTTSDKYSEIFDIPKAILKSVARSYLSDEIIYRKKMGFPVPLKLIEDDLLVIAYDILNDDSWLKIDEIDKIIEDINTEKNSVEVLLMIVSLQMFKNYYFSRDWRY
jgi:asparagine synthase (glutamine-hydrolysing)